MAAFKLSLSLFLKYFFFVVVRIVPVIVHIINPGLIQFAFSKYYPNLGFIRATSTQKKKNPYFESVWHQQFPKAWTGSSSCLSAVLSLQGPEPRLCDDLMKYTSPAPLSQSLY